MSNNQGSMLEALGQVQATQAGRVFRQYLRGAVREILTDVMVEEVNSLCGPSYHPDEETEHYLPAALPATSTWKPGATR